MLKYFLDSIATNLVYFFDWGHCYRSCSDTVLMRFVKPCELIDRNLIITLVYCCLALCTFIILVKYILVV